MRIEVARMAWQGRWRQRPLPLGLDHTVPGGLTCFKDLARLYACMTVG